MVINMDTKNEVILMNMKYNEAMQQENTCWLKNTDARLENLEFISSVSAAISTGDSNSLDAHLDKLNSELKEKAKKMGAKCIFGLTYQVGPVFNSSGSVILAYGDAYKIHV